MVIFLNHHEKMKPSCNYFSIVSIRSRWGLDLEGLEHWAERRQLPGVGVADLLDYRREHPEAARTRKGGTPLDSKRQRKRGGGGGGR